MRFQVTQKNRNLKVDYNTSIFYIRLNSLRLVWSRNWYYLPLFAHASEPELRTELVLNYQLFTKQLSLFGDICQFQESNPGLLDSSQATSALDHLGYTRPDLHHPYNPPYNVARIFPFGRRCEALSGRYSKPGISGLDSAIWDDRFIIPHQWMEWILQHVFILTN